MHTHNHNHINTHNHANIHHSENKKFLFFSLIISIFLVIAKSLIGFLIGSPALLASSIDSFMDAVSTSINRVILNISSKPADFKYPFGHGKFEAFSGLLQSLFIIIISSILLIYSVLNILSEFFYTEDISKNNINQLQTYQEYQELGIIIVIISIITPLILSYYMKKQAKKSKSLVLEAEHSHFFADGLMNSGVLVGLIFSYYFEIIWVDSLVGIFIALWLIWDIKDLLFSSFDVLTDKKLSCDIIEKIKQILNKEITEDNKTILGWHDLQTRRSGSEYHINIHLEFPDDTLLLTAHKKSDIIEEKIKKNFPNAIILTHFDLQSEYLHSHQ